MTLVLFWLLLGQTPIERPLVRSVEVTPSLLPLEGPERRGQILVTGFLDDGSRIDLTHEPALILRSGLPGVVDLLEGGQVVPRTEGRTELVARYEGIEARALVVVSGLSRPDPVDFARDVSPILGKLGCNGGACHGKSGGQNGFRLSLFGSNTVLDFESITREGRGRRIFPSVPRASLLLQKPSASLPHGGGLRFLPESPEYLTLQRWIAEGSPGPTSSVLAAELAIEPGRGQYRPGATQQLRVTWRQDGKAAIDVTRLARFECLTPEIAEVDDHGRVRVGMHHGEAIVSARYLGETALGRFAVPKRSTNPVPFLSSRNFVDRWVFQRLRALGEAPAPACSDAEFARRSALDIAGVLPVPEEVRAFESDTRPGKRLAWVDRWLDRPGYADRMAMTWGALLRNQRTLGTLSKPGTFALHSWIRQSFADNRPFDQFVADLLLAQGDPTDNPAVFWYRAYPKPETLAEDVAQLFLGVRLQCARCHQHPSDRWGPDDSRGFTAFFERLGRKPSDDPVTPSLFVERESQGGPPRWLGGPPIDTLKPGDDPRSVLVAWLRRSDNPTFARVIVNRVWKQYLGKGLVEPEDDFRGSNPPSHPELLDELAADFVAHGYDLRALARTILSSRTYERSSTPSEAGSIDPRGFGRFAPRRLPAEVLLDAIDTLAGVSTTFEGMPKGTRAIGLPDEGFDTPGGFLGTFGRPRRATACDCERSTEVNLSQSLLLLNGDEIERKVAHPDGRAARLSRDGRPVEEHIRELYRVSLGREPTSLEQADCQARLDHRRAEGRLSEGYEDLIWALLNTLEFQFLL